MNAKSIHTRWLAACIVLVMAACSGENMPPVPGEGEQGAVLVTVNVSTAADTRAGDPGTDHMEDQQRWDNLSLYLVYPDGTVTEHTVTKKELESENPVSFSTWTGTADLYAIAYAEPQQHVHCATPQDVYDLRTLNINDAEITDKQCYMQNLYAGRYMGVTIEADATKPEHVEVTLTRIISKVDVQYDMADALDGKYTDVQLSNMTFYGPNFGYFFPDKVFTTAASQKEISDEHYVVDGGISAVNGRTYFYTFPYRGDDATKPKHKFDFTVKYTKSGETTPGSTDYTATFGEALDANAWYYVTLNVRGDKGFANGNDTKITLTSGN